ncbi:Uncharacterised protein [Paenibacillus thiaminolyticus]|nr:Uncharacterised protein [Paenibacillus thiaminolyticus]
MFKSSFKTSVAPFPEQSNPLAITKTFCPPFDPHLCLTFVCTIVSPLSHFCLHHCLAFVSLLSAPLPRLCLFTAVLPLSAPRPSNPKKPPPTPREEPRSHPPLPGVRSVPGPAALTLAFALVRANYTLPAMALFAICFLHNYIDLAPLPSKMLQKYSIFIDPAIRTSESCKNAPILYVIAWFGHESSKMMYPCRNFPHITRQVEKIL